MNDVEPAPAKLNLYLHITGKRDDGYHLLDSFVLFTDFGDEVSVKPADELRLSIHGDDALPSKDNLVYRAAQMLQQRTRITQGAHLSLQKRIPVGAGLGGGSADAAATLRLLKRFWNVDISDDMMLDIARRLGADVAACYYSTPLFMAGIGDEITHIDYSMPHHIVLVNPNKELFTKDVYEAFKLPYESHYVRPFYDKPGAWMKTLAHSRNDLESAALSLMPEIQDILGTITKQSGCQFSRLCGSGATCFGLFDSQHSAEQAVQSMTKTHPHWWVQATHTKIS